MVERCLSKMRSRSRAVYRCQYRHIWLGPLGMKLAIHGMRECGYETYLTSLLRELFDPLFRRVRRFFGCRVSPEWVAERNKHSRFDEIRYILSLYLGVWFSHDIGIFIVQPTVTESPYKTISKADSPAIVDSEAMAFLEINLTHGFSQWLVGGYAGVVNLKDRIPQVCLLLLFCKPQ